MKIIERNKGVQGIEHGFQNFLLNIKKGIEPDLD